MTESQMTAGPKKVIGKAGKPKYSEARNWLMTCNTPTMEVTEWSEYLAAGSLYSRVQVERGGLQGRRHF